MERVALLSLSIGICVAVTACDRGDPAATEHPASVAGARAFMDDAEARLLESWIEAERASWVQENFITRDTEAIAAEAQRRKIATTVDLARESTRFDSIDLPADLRRKIHLLRTSLPLVAPPDPAQQAELASIAASLSSMYGAGRYCPEGSAGREESCLDMGDLERIMALSRDPHELLEAWTGWRTVSPPMREPYRRFVELGNAGARALGFDDLGALWRSGYDMPPAEFAAETERLWQQVRPLYEKLHCHVRARLAEHYGKDVVAPDGPIPAHLLGNLWAQDWTNIYDLVGPAEGDPGFDVGALLREHDVDAKQMVRLAEGFFTSLGFAPLPETFWERSLFTRPTDRDVQCHASAWDIDWVDDLRIKMCIDITAEDFVTVHHELGHNYYQRAYNTLAPLHRQGANDGFHEALGDTIALSITPAYLVRVGLLERDPGASGELGLLLRAALDKIAFLPFGMLVDQWRFGVFSGEIPPERYNAGWWDLARRYQGVEPKVARSEADFDPGAKYHVPANTPYLRYFLATILEFQFHRALCEAAGFEGPLYRCSIYGNEEAGRRLAEMMRLGASRPWPEALAVLTGEPALDATAILDYFAPLEQWLDRQNEGRTCGY